MNQFELFCMVFYVLDAVWDDTKDPVVREYLSDANPFLFADIGSAILSEFTHFCEVVTENITVANSYSLAQKYINNLHNENITKAFYSIDEEDWNESVTDFLSQEHKGGN